MNTRTPRRLLGICGILLLVVLLASSTGAAQAPTPAQGAITLVLKAPTYQLVPTDDGYTTIQVEGYSAAGEPGQPLLPHQLLDVALPPDVSWNSLSLTVRDVQTTVVPGTHKLPIVVPDQPGTGPALFLPSPPRRPVLSTDRWAGGEVSPARIAATGQMRKWHVARLDFCPFQYDAATGQLRVVEQATVELRFARTGEAANAALLADTVLDDVAATQFVNYVAARAWYPPAERASTATYNYVIITTNAIETSSTKLAAFVAHKQSKGYSVLVVTEDDYGGLAGQVPNGREEKVRQWLKNNYVAYSIKYVLLIGNPTPGGTGTTAVPMKMCWPRRGAGSDEDSPTDYFFADLTGNWNIDGDAYYGEWEDFTASGGVDLVPEVYVGRIPFYGSYTDLDNILQKTMDYANASSTNWRKSILLPMSFSLAGYDGAPLAEQMWDDYLNGAGYSRWRQYQQGTGACGPNSSYASDQELRGGTVVRDRWAAQDYGIVCWWGHGSQASASVGYEGCWDGTLFDNTQTSSLDDTHPSFTYQCSCTNGYPENSSNLQYAVLKRGGVTTVSASRVSWFNSGVGYGQFDGSTTNSGFGYEYVHRVVDGLTASEALYGAKSSMTPESNTRLMNFYDFNLYGDPAIRITSSGAVLTPRAFLPLILKTYPPLSLACGSNYPDNADSWMVYGPFSLVGATDGDLSFKLWLNTQSSYDGVARYASIDGSNFYGSFTSGNSSGWIDRVLDLKDVYTLGNLMGQPNVWIALVFRSNGSTNYAEGGYVDNIVLRKYVSASWSTVLSENFEGSFPGVWIVFDNNGTTYGEYKWDKRNCRPYAGSYSGWGVGGGTGSAMYTWLSGAPAGPSAGHIMDVPVAVTLQK